MSVFVWIMESPYVLQRVWTMQDNTTTGKCIYKIVHWKEGEEIVFCCVDIIQSKSIREAQIFTSEFTVWPNSNFSVRLFRKTLYANDVQK
jgi:hypothetical protein